MSQGLTNQIAYDALQNFFLNNNPFVLFGTGPSIAVDSDFGMAKLKEVLCEEIPKKNLNNIQETEWNKVTEFLKNDNNLEAALDEVRDEDLIRLVVMVTYEKLRELNQKYYWEILSGKTTWPTLPLFKRLVDGLPETDRVLHVATTNYDLLAEAAFEKGNLPFSTGFYGGVCRHLDWEQAVQSMTYTDRVNKPRSKKIERETKIKKHIRLYKVHGSLNTFMYNNEMVENNYWISECPPGIERVIITPGSGKYRRLHDYRQALLSEYDRAIEKHNAFLFIGFGFNDSQLINKSLKKKLTNSQCPVLILTRSNNEKIRELLSKNENLWLVCKNPDGDDESTMICNSRYDRCLFLNGKRLWDTGKFAAEILGG